MLNISQRDLVAILRSHWVETANDKDLDMLGTLFNLYRRRNENDEFFRRRIMYAIHQFTGGGTIRSILTNTRLYLNMRDDEQLELIENPKAVLSIEKRVVGGNTWLMSNEGVRDEEEASLTISVESKNGEVLNPTIMNLDSGYFLRFNGRLRYGQVLIIHSNHAEIDGKDVSDMILGAPLKISRIRSRWQFSEDLTPKIGKFNEAVFNEHIFETPLTDVNLRFEWTTMLRATFELRLPSKVLDRNNVSVEDVQDTVNLLKAAGINAIIKVM
jgi:hypothetical protein